MNTKLQKTINEIERVRAKIAELQVLLPELEKQKTDLENFEIIKMVRNANIAPGDLSAFIDEYRAGLTAPPSPTAEPVPVSAAGRRQGEEALSHGQEE